MAQQCGRAHGLSGADLCGVLAAYEAQINLVKAIVCTRTRTTSRIFVRRRRWESAHFWGSSREVVCQRRSSRRFMLVHHAAIPQGEISSWRAYALTHSGKLAIEAVDRAMRGEKSPSPIYEGEDSVIAHMLGGAGATYTIELPDKGEPYRAILDSYTKQHSASTRARRYRPGLQHARQVADFETIVEFIYTATTRICNRHGRE